VLLFYGVSAALFALLYFPAVARLAMALVSRYPKANTQKRLFAAVIDGLLVMTTWFVYQALGSIAPVAGGAVYLLLRDAVGGQSIGKIMMGLTVIRVETGRPCSVLGSIQRNAMLLVPGANIVAVFLEPVTILRDPQGQRLGDRLAQTQVVEGFGATDLASSAYDWWRNFIVGLEKDPMRRRPRAEEIDFVSSVLAVSVLNLRVEAGRRFSLYEDATPGTVLVTGIESRCREADPPPFNSE
jgi:uncharacterized RDD family membrane protein YckC